MRAHARRGSSTVPSVRPATRLALPAIRPSRVGVGRSSVGRSVGPSCLDPAGDKSSPASAIRSTRLQRRQQLLLHRYPTVRPLSNSWWAVPVQRRWWAGNGKQRSLSVFYGSKYVSVMAACVHVIADLRSAHSGCCSPAVKCLISSWIQRSRATWTSHSRSYRRAELATRKHPEMHLISRATFRSSALMFAAVYCMIVVSVILHLRISLLASSVTNHPKIRLVCHNFSML